MSRTRFPVVLTIVFALVASPLFAADAAATYKAKCFACHGEKGRGDTTMGRKLAVRNLATPAVQSQTDAVLTKIITDGKNRMPAFKGKIADADIKALVAHIRTFAPAK